MEKLQKASIKVLLTFLFLTGIATSAFSESYLVLTIDGVDYFPEDDDAPVIFQTSADDEPTLEEKIKSIKGSLAALKFPKNRRERITYEMKFSKLTTKMLDLRRSIKATKTDPSLSGTPSLSGLIAAIRNALKSVRGSTGQSSLTASQRRAQEALKRLLKAVR